MWLEEDEGKTTGQRAEENFIRAASIHYRVDKATGGKGWGAEDGTNIAAGQNILREETGYFGPWQGTRYSFDQDTRDRLLAHGRQDIASAALMARSAFREAFFARQLASRAIWLIALSVGVNVAVLSTLWWS